jgi:hypothetical protein
VDDGSTDQSREVLAVVADRFPFVRIVEHGTNRGVIQAILTGVGMVQTRFFGTFGADDPLDLQFIEKASELLDAHPGARLLGAEHRVFLRHEGHKYGYRSLIKLANAPSFLDARRFQSTFAGKEAAFQIGTTPMLWEKKAWLDAGGVQPELRWAADWFTALVMGFRHGIAFIPDYLQDVMLRASSFSRSGQSDPAACIQVIRAVLDQLEKPAFADVREAFMLPSVLSHFGIRLLLVLADDRYAWMRSPGLLHAAVMTEGFRMDTPPGRWKGGIPREEWEAATGNLAISLAQNATELALTGQYHDALRLALRSREALPGEAKVTSLIDRIQRAIDRTRRR